MNVLLTKKFMSSDIEYLNAGLAEGITLLEPAAYSEAGVLEKIRSAQVLFGGMLSLSLIHI